MKANKDVFLFVVRVSIVFALSHVFSGCYLPPRFLVYNNTEESVCVVADTGEYDLTEHGTVKFSVKSVRHPVECQKGGVRLMYYFPVVDSEKMYDKSLIVRMQINPDDVLYVLKPKTKFPANIAAQPESVVMKIQPDSKKVVRPRSGELDKRGTKVENARRGE